MIAVWSISAWAVQQQSKERGVVENPWSHHKICSFCVRDWTSFSTKEVCLGNILLERGRSHCRIRGPGGTWEVISFNPLILETRHFLYLLKWKYLFQVIQVKNGTRARARMFCFFHYIITRLCSLLGKEGSYVAPCVGLFLRTGLKSY